MLPFIFLASHTEGRKKESKTSVFEKGLDSFYNCVLKKGIRILNIPVYLYSMLHIQLNKDTELCYTKLQNIQQFVHWG